jgi:site-specific recombinase XerC
MRRWCSPGIASTIDGPRLFKEEGLPAGPIWDDVERLITSTNGADARDVRDRAILMLLAIYGLRSGEVRQLRLEDPVHVVAARCGHDPAMLLRNYAKRTKKADTSAAEVIGSLSKGVLGN